MAVCKQLWQRKDRPGIYGWIEAEHKAYVWFAMHNTMPQTMLRYVLERDWQPVEMSRQKKISLARQSVTTAGKA